MPDVFVPMDTTGNSEYLEKISRKGLIYSFAYAYADSHRDVLSEYKTAEEFDSFLDQQNVLNEFVNYASEKEIVRDATILIMTKAMMKAKCEWLIFVVIKKQKKRKGNYD